VGRFQLYLSDSVVPFLYAREVVIKSFKLIILIKSVVIIHVINLQYISVTKIINVNCKYCNSGVRNK